MAYTPKHSVRIVTAASLFDGHDASINIMRRILQEMGAEVIHLGHNRSVRDVVAACLQEGVQGVCISSYQGGHMEYFKYLKDLLKACGADDVKVFGGGKCTIEARFGRNFRVLTHHIKGAIPADMEGQPILYELCGPDC